MSQDPLAVVKVGRSGSQSCPVVGVLVSILQRMAWVVLAEEGEFGEWDVGPGERRSAVVAVVAAGCAVCEPQIPLVQWVCQTVPCSETW